MAWHFDEGYHYDNSEAVEIVAEMELEISYQHIHRPFQNLEITAEIEIDYDLVHAISLDLLRLIPTKYHNAQILLDYIDEVELEIGSWLTSVRDIVKLSNPNLVSTRKYLKNLAALIGLDLPPEDDSTEDEIRRSISQAIDWYKIKGTYKSIEVIALIQKFSVNIYDMYTNDYNTFYLQNWFVGEENENPPGFDATYYKSPHFGIEILLNQVYSGEGSGASGSGVSGSGVSGSEGFPTAHLWRTSYLDNFYKLVEQTRPVHTVPHYILFLNPKTDELGHVIEVSGNIQTRILGDWEYTTKYFDMIKDDPSLAWDFDDEVTYFDESTTSFIYSVTKWVLGTGSNDINSSSWVLEEPVLTGTIDSNNIEITEEKITYSFVVPKLIAQNGIRELALYTNDDKLVLGSVFPSIDKDPRTELKVTVEIFREDLSS